MIESLLRELSVDWHVALTSDPDGAFQGSEWTLRIRSKRASRGERPEHAYRGTLASVVQRAHAGEPGDRIGADW